MWTRTERKEAREVEGKPILGALDEQWLERLVVLNRTAPVSLGADEVWKKHHSL